MELCRGFCVASWKGGVSSWDRGAASLDSAGGDIAGGVSIAGLGNEEARDGWRDWSMLD